MAKLHPLLELVVPLLFSASPAVGTDGGELRDRVAAELEMLHRRLGEGLVWEERVVGGWLAGARAHIPPWSVVLWANKPSHTSVACVSVLVSRRGSHLRADVWAGLLVNGELWGLVGAIYQCSQSGPPPDVDLFSWLSEQRRLTPANVNIWKDTREQRPRVLAISHSCLSMLCALGVCLGWEQGKPVWLGPHLSNEDRPGFSMSAIALYSNELHTEPIWQKGREYFRRHIFDVALPVLVREASTVRTDLETGLVIAEASNTKVWLAPDYGYQPVRREWYCLLEHHLLAVDEFSDYREIGDGVWLPFRWHRTYARDAYRGEVSDAVVVVRRAELRAPDEAELRELFLNAVPEERTYVVDFRWLRNPFTGRPRYVMYPFRRDPTELAALREQAVARARAQMAWILRVAPRVGGNAAVPVAVAVLLLAVAGLFVWIAWRCRRRKEKA